jgi:hypothetical protein
MVGGSVYILCYEQVKLSEHYFGYCNEEIRDVYRSSSNTRIVKPVGLYDGVSI